MGALTVLDVDVSPSVCVLEARLGSEADFVRCVKLARVVKPTRHAAFEMLELLKADGGDAGSEEIHEDMPSGELGRSLVHACTRTCVDAFMPTLSPLSPPSLPLSPPLVHYSYHHHYSIPLW